MSRVSQDILGTLEFRDIQDTLVILVSLDILDIAVSRDTLDIVDLVSLVTREHLVIPDIVVSQDTPGTAENLAIRVIVVIVAQASPVILVIRGSRAILDIPVLVDTLVIPVSQVTVDTVVHVFPDTLVQE